MISIFFFRITTLLRYEWPYWDVSTPPTFFCWGQVCDIRFPNTPKQRNSGGRGSLLWTFEFGGVLCWEVRSWAIQSDSKPWRRFYWTGINSDSCRPFNTMVRSLTLEVSLTHSFFMNHFNSKEQDEMSSNIVATKITHKHPHFLPFLPIAACLIQLSQFFPVWTPVSTCDSIWRNSSNPRGAPINVIDKFGQTPLFRAVRGLRIWNHGVFWNGLHRLIICDWC